MKTTGINPGRRRSKQNTDPSRSSCEAADRVRDDSAAFQQAMRKKITPEEQNYLKHADAASLELLLSCCLGNAEVQRDLKEKGDGLIKRAGKSTQVFANNFASYLQAYSGIIEIMQGADNQYGGAAYASLSLLLIVSSIFILCRAILMRGAGCCK